MMKTPLISVNSVAYFSYGLLFIARQVLGLYQKGRIPFSVSTGKTIRVPPITGCKSESSSII